MPKPAAKLNADATIYLSIVRDHYRHGALYIQPEFSSNGTREWGERQRIILTDSMELSVLEVWDTLFEAVVEVQKRITGTVGFNLDLDGAASWQRNAILALTLAIAHELRVKLPV